MGKRILYRLVCKKNDLDENILVSCFKLGCDYFTPVRMCRGKKTNRRYYKYNEKRFFSGLVDELSDDRIRIELQTDGMKSNSVELYTSGMNSDYLILSYILDYNIINDKFLLRFEQFFINRGIVGYCCNFYDNVQQNATDISFYEGSDYDLSQLVIRGNDVDIEYNPGHSHRIGGLWFGSCYRMWFGKEYYNYIRKAKFQLFKNCYENIELENEVIRITLYKDILDFDKPQNRERQWEFRRSVGMDDAAIRLKRIQEEKEADPELEILTGTFEHGGVRMFKQYYDENGKSVVKSKARKVHIEEYDRSGKSVYSHDVDL